MRATRIRSATLGVEPTWLTFADVRDIHDDQLGRFGGLAGVKDDNLIHSAVAAPRNLFLYEEEEDVLVLAIKLCVALAKNHGFNDGNKRTAAVAMIEFLAVNGYDLLIPDDEPDAPILGRWVEQAVTGELDSLQIYDRLEHFVQARDD